MDYWVIFTRSVEESFLCISLLSFIFYFMIFIYGFFSLKTATSMNKNKPSALYHFTSKSCLDKIASCRIIISTKYGVVFSTSDKKKNKRGRSCNPFKRNGVIIFSGESLNCFNVNFTPSLLRLIFLYKIIEADTKEYITKSYGDLHLSQVEEINSHMLLVKKATIKPCDKKYILSEN